ncbi:MAG: hypothetical protein WBQ34_00240 [Candidatus Acidiferrales bacterium]
MAVLVVAAFLLFISPTIFTLGWHVVHGNTVEFKDHTVAVPLRWTAESEGQLSLSMTKYPATAVDGVRFTATLWISPTLPSSNENPRADYRFWEKTFWNTALSGQAVKGPIVMGSGRHEVICMEAIDAKEVALQSASCLMLNGTWEANYLGNADELGRFFKMVRDFN